MAAQKPTTHKLTPEHYRQHRKVLAKKGTVQKVHSISTKNNIHGLKDNWIK